jgi:hypothetical protein
MNDSIGYLTWWTVPDVSAPYGDLLDLAAQAGYPADCVPISPAPRNAWEKATNVGSRGLKVDAPADLVAQVRHDYNTEPVVRVLTRRVCNSAPVLKRHLVREAVIPLANRTKKQLSLDTVAVLEFDVSTNQAKTTLVPDSAGWINGSIRQIVADVDARMVHLLNHADGQDVREGVRKLLEQMHRVSLRGTGGVYFVPETVPGARDRLKALRRYVRAMDRWKTGVLTPNCQVVTLRGEDAFEIRADIIASAIDEFKTRIDDLAEKVEPVLKGRARGRVAGQINRQAMETLLEIKAGVAAYRESLDDDLQALDDMMRMAQAAVLKAAGMG